jgi:catechol 2,3-dioxygenase-like lactoylglutathione lyase family enzyme
VPLNHVALTVRDRELSAAFYGRHFGLTERLHADEHLMILGSSDGSVLALSEGAVPAGLPRTNHFGFQLADAEEVRAARERLLEAGVTETEWQDDHGFARVQVADPDGYRVELYALPDMPAAPTRRPPPSSPWTSFLADAGE